MRAFVRRALLLVYPLVLEMAPTWRVSRAAADHGGPLASAPMSPVLVGLIAAALALAAGAIVLVITRLLFSRKAPPAE